MILLRILLFPITLLYDGVTRLRNHLFNIGHRRSFRFEIPVIAVGNLNVGGSGKTPMIEYLIRLLLKDNHLAILSRGYGRVTRGLRFGNEHETARTFGDEPMQFLRSFKGQVTVAVCEDRAFAIPNILQEFPETNLILLDDAFQHRSVNPHLNILLTEHVLPFYADYVMPFGKLREARIGAARADIIVVTKCPSGIAKSEMEGMITEINKWSGKKPIFFTTIEYGRPISFGGVDHSLTSDVVLVSGIANHQVFEEYSQKKFQVVKHFAFRDHHRYTKDELLNIQQYITSLNKPVSLLTTEKDMVRLIDSEFSDSIATLSCYYLPIETVFVKDGAEFDKLVSRVIG